VELPARAELAEDRVEAAGQGVEHALAGPRMRILAMEPVPVRHRTG
jgi:hypothetical protein